MGVLIWLSIASAALAGESPVGRRGALELVPSKILLLKVEWFTGKSLEGTEMMPRATLPPHAAVVMAMFGFPHGFDIHESLFWRTGDDGRIFLFVDCSDFFAYASAESEAIHVVDMPLLEMCYEDIKALNDPLSEIYLPELFAARKRNMAPMPAATKDMKPELLALFPKEEASV